MSSGLQKRQRNYSYDIIRIIAVIAVVTIHSCSPLLMRTEFQSAEFTLGNFLDSFARIAVPLFLMISGSLMLDEEKSVPTKKLIKSAGNIYFLLLCWSALYAISFKFIYPIVTNKAFDFKALIKAFINGHYHLWYLFMIAGLYLLTPVLRAFIKKENSKLIGYFLLLSIFFYLSPIFLNVFFNMVLPFKNIYKNYVASFKFTYTNEFLFYYISGWFITNVKIEKKYRAILYAFGIIGLLITFLGTQIMPPKDENFTTFYSTAMLNVVVFALAVFMFFYNMFKDSSFEKSGKLIKTLSALTFGVYLIHPFFLFAVRTLITDKMTVSALSYAIDFFSALVLSFAASFIMSKIPLIKKLIRC